MFDMLMRISYSKPDLKTTLYGNTFFDNEINANMFLAVQRFIKKSAIRELISFIELAERNRFKV